MKTYINSYEKLSREFLFLSLVDLELSLIKPSILAAVAMSFSLDKIINYQTVKFKENAQIRYCWTQFVEECLSGRSVSQIELFREEIFRRLSHLRQDLTLCTKNQSLCYLFRRKVIKHL
jgi:hypothetical protein